MNPSALSAQTALLRLTEQLLPACFSLKKQENASASLVTKELEGRVMQGPAVSRLHRTGPGPPLVYRTATLTYWLKNQAQREESGEAHSVGEQHKEHEVLQNQAFQ